MDYPMKLCQIEDPNFVRKNSYSLLNYGKSNIKNHILLINTRMARLKVVLKSWKTCFKNVRTANRTSSRNSQLEKYLHWWYGCITIPKTNWKTNQNFDTHEEKFASVKPQPIKRCWENFEEIQKNTMTKTPNNSLNYL